MERRPVSISNPLARNASFTVSSIPATPGQAAPSLAESDLYQEITALHFLHLSPEYMQNLTEGVMIQLQEMLLQWNNDLQGVPLLFSRVELTPAPTTQPIPLPSGYPTPQNTSNQPVTSAAIIAENPQLHMWVRVRWLAFCPSPGSRVVGTLVKQNHEQLNLLLLNHFSAVIKRDQLAGSLEWNEAEQTWCTEQGKRVNLGHLMEFEVLHVKTGDQNMIRIIGSLDKMQQPAPPKKKTKKN